MSKKFDYQLGKVHRPPEGKAFVWHTLDLMTSPAWQHRSILCARLLEFLEIENMRHAGKENGQLLATYDQLHKFGVGRRFIPATINEAEELGLLEASRRGYRTAMNKSYETHFRLTYLAAKVFPPHGSPYFAVPTNEWERVTEEKAQEIAARAAAARRQKAEPKSKIRGAKGELKQVHKVNSMGSPFDTSPPGPLGNAEAVSAVRGAKGEPLSISRDLPAPANDSDPTAQPDGQGDIEAYLARQQPASPDAVRRDLQAHVENSGRGSLTRIAAAAGTTAAKLSQFKSGGTLAPEAVEALARALQEAKAA